MSNTTLNILLLRCFI